MLLTFNQEIQAADTERRVISGLVAPYGEVGFTSAGPVMFERGAIAIPDATKIKLLSQHQQDKPVGRALSFSEATDGVMDLSVCRVALEDKMRSYSLRKIS